MPPYGTFILWIEVASRPVISGRLVLNLMARGWRGWVIVAAWLLATGEPALRAQQSAPPQPRPTKDQATGVLDRQQQPSQDVFPPPPDLAPPQNAPHLPPPPLLVAPPPPPLASRSEAIRAILGLIGIAALAYLAGHPRVERLERNLGIFQVVTAGMPFVILGLVGHQAGVGVLSDTVLWHIRPLLALGLGWIGFTVGYRFDAPLVESLSRGMAKVGLFTTSIPFVVIMAVCGLVLLVIEHVTTSAVFLRDALVLATAGAMTAHTAPALLRDRGAENRAVDRVWSVVQLEQLTAVAGLLFIAAYFRPPGAAVAWQLPGTAWLFVTLGMGTTIGGLIYLTLGRVKAGPEFSLLMLGSVCFASGMAGYLRLSPIVVCFIAGVILVNLPGGSQHHVRGALARLERPIYLLFLLIAGSLWQVSDWRGWVLMVFFVAARLGGNWLAVMFCLKRGLGELQRDERRSLVFAPVGTLSIATVVNAKDLYSSATMPWIVTTVIGGAMVTEFIVQFATRGIGAGDESPSKPARAEQGVEP